jgi:hypothetical protein
MRKMVKDWPYTLLRTFTESWRYSSCLSYLSAFGGDDYPRQLKPWRSSRWYPSYRKLGGPQSQSGCGGEETNGRTRWKSNPDSPIMFTAAYSLYRLKYLIKIALCCEGVWRNGCIDPRFLDLGTS